jgi:hypothetical protein
MGPRSLQPGREPGGEKTTVAPETQKHETTDFVNLK